MFTNRACSSCMVSGLMCPSTSLMNLVSTSKAKLRGTSPLTLTPGISSVLVDMWCTSAPAKDLHYNGRGGQLPAGSVRPCRIPPPFEGEGVGVNRYPCLYQPREPAHVIVMTMGYVDEIYVIMVQPEQAQIVVQDQLRRPGVE